VILTPPKLIFLTALVSFSSAHAEELGRLFFTPAQRQQLELATQKAPAPADTPRAITVNGIVQKTGGKRTVWLNGTAQEANADMARTPESEPLTLHGISSPVSVKVGQRVFVQPSASNAKH